MIAVVEGSYGGGYDQQAHVSVVQSFRDHASGLAPLSIKTTRKESIENNLKKAKGEGCIGVIVDIVRPKNGRVMPAEEWKILVKTCQMLELIVIADETLTAIRCGAPFAYQRAEYWGFAPDLVLFGKGLQANVIAIDWDGAFVKSLGYSDPSSGQPEGPK